MKRALRNRFILALAFALGAAGVYAAGEGRGEEPAAGPRPAVAVDEDADGPGEDTRPGRAAVRVYLDPATGLMRSRPTDAEEQTEAQPPAPGERFSRYGGDLLQEPIPQGGFKVDLRGRFQSAVVATIDPETDTVSIDCVSPAVAAEAPDAR